MFALLARSVLIVCLALQGMPMSSASAHEGCSHRHRQVQPEAAASHTTPCHGMSKDVETGQSDPARRAPDPHSANHDQSAQCCADGGCHCVSLHAGALDVVMLTHTSIQPVDAPSTALPRHWASRLSDTPLRPPAQ
jgi:hypothetical protein